MTDNEVWKIITSTLEQLLKDCGIEAELFRSYQQRQQGVAEKAAVYFYAISSRRYGHQGKKTVEREIDGEKKCFTQESWWLERTYQVSTEFEENPADPSQLTPFDIADQVAAQLQSDKFRQVLLENGIGIQRITDIRTPYFKDESERWQLEPNFDFILNYQQNKLTEVPAVSEINLNINRV